MSNATFTSRAAKSLRNSQLRRNINKATTTIRGKTARVTAELPDWEALRLAGREIKRSTLAELDKHLIALEESVTRAGGTVHWARDAAEAREIVVRLTKAHNTDQVIKIKSMTTDEIELNPALEGAGIRPYETDLADMIVQMGREKPSHLLVPAIHKNRVEIRDLFRDQMGSHGEGLSDRPTDLTKAARAYLRDKFLETRVAISGANFAVAETGSVVVVESEGNGRMCLTLPDVLISIMGIEKVLPRWQDLEVFLQLLPRAATGERMNPYTSIWTGTVPGDGPREFHLVLLDNGRSKILADEVSRETLHCIRCSRCLNVCPVYERAGGHAYDSMYQGPIGAIVTPQLKGLEEAGSLPYASSLCGACHEVCPVKINIPQILVHLRGKVVESKRETALGKLSGENMAMQVASRLFNNQQALEWSLWAGRLGQKLLTRDGVMPWLPPPLSGWTLSRDFPALPEQSFRDWWKQRENGK
ncbi:lactate utilization protein B [Niveispirillum irakense]|uniref:lactate utilization protein B n=1 Tax=Niveispirillum irakense TaxID=34011 RepID=UPI0003FDA262|nr:lactate utilization protein B [Niveispirillum irakense]